MLQKLVFRNYSWGCEIITHHTTDYGHKYLQNKTKHLCCSMCSYYRSLLSHVAPSLCGVELPMAPLHHVSYRFYGESRGCQGLHGMLHHRWWLRQGGPLHHHHRQAAFPSCIVRHDWWPPYPCVAHLTGWIYYVSSICSL